MHVICFTALKSIYPHVTPWLIHVNVWQNPLKFCEVIGLQLVKINEKKKKSIYPKNEKKRNLSKYPPILTTYQPKWGRHMYTHEEKRNECYSARRHSLSQGQRVLYFSSSQWSDLSVSKGCHRQQLLPIVSWWALSEGKNICHLAGIRLQPLPTGKTQDTSPR